MQRGGYILFFLFLLYLSSFLFSRISSQEEDYTVSINSRNTKPQMVRTRGNEMLLARGRAFGSSAFDFRSLYLYAGSSETGTHDAYTQPGARQATFAASYLLVLLPPSLIPPGFGTSDPSQHHDDI
ncbi:hypothetical protein F5Y03DRAFT_344465 [Xylaria venustula]|nr:hypothetical protein F5Y03DRAFT_344465 [Xylaria venustula]